MNIKIKKFKENAFLPIKGTDGAAAYDLKIPNGFCFDKPGRFVIPLGFGLEIPKGMEAKIEPRSGFSSKGVEGVTPWGSRERFDADVLVGKIDSDYRGEIGVIISNRSNQEFVLTPGTRIAQLTFYQVEEAEFQEVDELSETKRGSGGFGHTGSNEIKQ